MLKFVLAKSFFSQILFWPKFLFGPNTFSSNITGTWNLLDSVRIHSPKSKVVISTSDKAYGIPESIPTKEDHKLHGVFPYEFSKSSEDLLAQTYATTYGLDIAILRCGNVFGGGDLNFSRLIPMPSAWKLNTEK